MIDWITELDEDKQDKGNIFFDEFIFMIANPKNYHEKATIYLDLPKYLSDKFTSCFELYEKAKKIQEIKLKKYGVADRLNAAMTKFVLINNHDWKEKTSQELIVTPTKVKIEFGDPDNG
jgi:hypothetical protein